MQLSRKYLLAAALTGGTVLLTASIATAGGWGGHGHHGGRGMSLFDSFDTNQDGKVTQAEIDTARTQRLESFDSDNNGELSLEEYRALWADAMQRMMVRAFQANDADGNGTITVEEFSVRYENVVRDLDRNGDGELTMDEVRRRGRHGDGSRD